MKICYTGKVLEGFGLSGMAVSPIFASMAEILILGDENDALEETILTQKIILTKYPTTFLELDSMRGKVCVGKQFWGSICWRAG